MRHVLNLLCRFFESDFFCTIPFLYNIIQSSLFKAIFLSIDLSTCFYIYCSSWISHTHTHTHTPFKLESKQKEKDKCPTISILTNENIVDSLKPTTKWFILQKALDSAISLLPNKMCTYFSTFEPFSFILFLSINLAFNTSWSRIASIARKIKAEKSDPQTREKKKKTCAAH